MGDITFDQIRAPLERILLVALAYAAGRHWITENEIAGYATLLLGLISAVYGYWKNRPKGVLQSAAAVPNTTVVTTEALAKATSEKNIVSNDTNKVVAR